MGNRKNCPGTTAPTPGPWHTRADMKGVQIANAAGICVARTPCFDRQAQADGALLAAAPDLLAALKDLLYSIEPDDSAAWHKGSGVVEARAAIAKAEGRS